MWEGLWFYQIRSVIAFKHMKIRTVCEQYISLDIGLLLSFKFVTDLYADGNRRA